jgi:pilus assembly protein CpaD
MENDLMAAQIFGSERLTLPGRPLLTLLAVLVMAAPVGGCISQGPRFQAPFTLANPDERWPILVKQGEATLDLTVNRGSAGLTEPQKSQLRAFLWDYRNQRAERLMVRAPSGGPNETAAMRAFQDVRRAMRQTGIDPRAVVSEPYFANYDPSAPLRISYLRTVAKAPDCPDWSENIARDPQNMPWPNMGCATQRNLAMSVADPNDLVQPRAETPRSSERRDVVWGKYVNGQVTGSDWAPDKKPVSEHATASGIGQVGASQ